MGHADVDESSRQVLAAVAVRCLPRVEDQYRAWLLLLKQSGLYGDSWVDHDEVRAKALEVFELIWRRIAGFEVADDLAEVSHRVGVRRAEQGVPINEVQAAANRDFQIVWEAMLAAADEHEATVLLHQAPAVWAVVDDHTQRITEAYRRRSNELDDLSDDRRREWFRRLLKCNGERADVVQNAADVLDLPVDGRFRVVIATREHAGRLRDARDALTALRWSFHYQEVEGGDLLVIRSTQEQDKRVLNCLAGIRCAVAPPAHGLDEVPRATRIASDILAALPEDRDSPGMLEDAWLSVAATQAPLVTQALADRIHRCLENVQDADVLLETAQVFCEGDGTVSRAASELFCHRNTVLNRLERLRSLTGFDVRRPRDAAGFLFAMTAGKPTGRSL
ncbi:PucR family transcriptional regulator [Pseudonocardia sulfidoxydans]|uniref:PucR family transcriptional regulator n=1 Tax=Pseudonocardia sulfidoxydans TaxID=54011 RepID=UPI003610F442